MENLKELEELLFESLRACEEMGQWSDSEIDTLKRIDGSCFKDCADFCTLCIRLILRKSDQLFEVSPICIISLLCVERN